MKGRNESLYFTFALAIFLFAIVLLLNLIEPTAIPVSEDQYSKIRDTHLIDALVICPTGTYWQLKQSVRIEREGGEECGDAHMVGPVCGAAHQRVGEDLGESDLVHDERS